MQRLLGALDTPPAFVRLHRTAVKYFIHPAVGRLHLAFDAMELPAEAGLTLTAYTAGPGRSSEDGPRLLATWAAADQSTGQTAASNEMAPDRGPERSDPWPSPSYPRLQLPSRRVHAAMRGAHPCADPRGA